MQSCCAISHIDGLRAPVLLVTEEARLDLLELILDALHVRSLSGLLGIQLRRQCGTPVVVAMKNGMKKYKISRQSDVRRSTRQTSTGHKTIRAQVANSMGWEMR